MINDSKKCKIKIKIETGKERRKDKSVK